MSNVGKRTIYVGPAGNQNSKPLNLEGIAIAAIAPGTFLTKSAAGLNASAAAATVFGNLPLFADKDQQRSRSVDDNWTINENMVSIQARSGEFLNVLVATGQTLIVGDPLVSNGAGLLIKGSSAGTQHVIAWSDEAIVTAATVLVRARFE